MKGRLWLLLTGGLLAWQVSFATPLLLLDSEQLASIKTKVEAKDPFVTPAFQALVVDANKALKVNRLTVVDKVTLPPSGDKHDYLSLAPYFWQESAHGGKAIRRDGEVNPKARVDSDATRLATLARLVESLSLAYYYTGDTKYAKHALKLTKGWFIDDATKMNPHLKFAQGIPGKSAGRSLGILEGRHLVRVMDSLTLLEPSGLIEPDVLKGFKAWLADYQTWLLTSDFGYEESLRPNNHGTYYDYQVVALHLYLNDQVAAGSALKRAQYVRLGAHIGSKGQNFHELERTRPLHYSLFDLEGLVGLARYGDQFDNIDVWRFTINQTSLKKAVDYVVKYKNQPDQWLVKSEKVNFDPLTGILLVVSQKFETKDYADEIEALWQMNPKNIAFLKWEFKGD